MDDDAYWQDGLPYLLWRTQSVVHRTLQDSLAELGVSVTQWGLTLHLDRYGALSSSDLSRGFHITRQSANTALAQLEELGWVARRAHPTNRRVIWFELTAAGRDGAAKGREVARIVAQRLDDSVQRSGSPALVREALRTIIHDFDGPQSPFTPAWPSGPLPEDRAL